MSRVMQGLVVLCLLWSASVHAASLTHGPLLGNVTPSSAVVWVRTSEKATVVAEWSRSGDFTDGVKSSPIVTAAAFDFTAHLRLTGLPTGPTGTEVSYKVWLGAEATPVKRFRTAPALGAATDWEMVLPVFSDWSRSQPFPGLEVAIARGADAVMFLGDFDHRNPITLNNMRNMHKSLRSESTRLGQDVKAGLIDATVQVPLYHVWDDHDMRGDNADKYSGNIPEARKAFREYYPMPSDAGDETPIYQKFSFAKVDVFILDLRSERDPGMVPDDGSKSMLGLAQKAWFKADLLASRAVWKVIMSSVPWNPTSKNGDAWKGFPTEQNELVSFIESNKITGVLFASGDLHLGGALDDGSNSYFPEANCPKANDTFNHTGKVGKWSEGFSRGGVGAGFCEFVLTSTTATINIVGDDGTVRWRLECKAGQTGKCKAP